VVAPPGYAYAKVVHIAEGDFQFFEQRRIPLSALERLEFRELTP